MRKIETIIIHCSDSPNGRTLFTGKLGDKNFTTPVQEIDRWHRERDFKRLPLWRAKQNPELSSIGYHFVIYTRGAVASGRHVDEIGAHCQGYNATSIGICLIGRDAFTSAQWLALAKLVESLKKSNPTARVVAHHDLNAAKTCPNFNVAAWLEGESV
jgi:N-acetyl-anhydromuramyl-L-alanine amidase AmpD